MTEKEEKIMKAVQFISTTSLTSYKIELLEHKYCKKPTRGECS